jgi:hypothetical protein
VRLLDTSRIDALAVTIDELVLEDVDLTAVEDTGLEFQLSAEEVQPRARYEVGVLVDLDGDGRPSVGDYINTRSYPVLTRGYPDKVEVQVNPIGRPASPSAPKQHEASGDRGRDGPAQGASEVTIPRVGRPTQGNVRKLTRMLREDADLRGVAGAQIRRSPYRFAELAFELTPRERDTMRRIPGSLADVLGRAYILMLEAGGDFDFRLLAVAPDPETGPAPGEATIRAKLKLEGDIDRQATVARLEIEWEKHS